MPLAQYAGGLFTFNDRACGYFRLYEQQYRPTTRPVTTNPIDNRRKPCKESRSMQFMLCLTYLSLPFYLNQSRGAVFRRRHLMNIYALAPFAPILLAAPFILFLPAILLAFDELEIRIRGHNIGPIIGLLLFLICMSCLFLSSFLVG